MFRKGFIALHYVVAKTWFGCCIKLRQNVLN